MMSQNETIKQSDLSKIIERIKKLLALSKSPNEAEAASALNKTNDLLMQYNLSMSQISSTDQDPIKSTAIECSGASKKWRHSLITTLSRVNLCHAILGHDSHYFVILGREVNIHSVMIMWEYLDKAVNRIHQKECPRQAKSHYRESFKLGIAHGISEKLEEQYWKNNTGAINALVVSEKSRIDEFLKDKGIELKSSPVEIEKKIAYRNGLIHGRQVNLNNQIQNNNSNLSIDN